MESDAPTLSSAQIKGFKAQAHHLSPVVMVGAAGLSQAVIGEIDLALNAHELIKVKLAGEDRKQRTEMQQQICSALQCAPVQLIGKVAVLYRPAPVKEADEPHRPKKQIAQGVTKAPSRGGKARAKPAKPSGRTNPQKLRRGPSNRVHAETTKKRGERKR